MNENKFKRQNLQRELLRGISFIVLFCTIILSCTSSKNLKDKKEALMTGQKPGQSTGSNGIAGSTSIEDLDFDEHASIFLEPGPTKSVLPNSNDSLATVKIKMESDPRLKDVLQKELGIIDYSKVKSIVADRIVENYLNSKNKEPGGHCLAVSKRRFEKAYKDVYGHSVYEDLPDSLATTYYSPSEVFDYLYVTATGTHEGWRSLPKKYRGKGNAGAIAYAGMGKLVDWFGIWSGELKPGAMMQVWKHRKDYEKVVRGVNKKDFDPFGHSFIFIGYVRDDKNKIVGIRIADQGYQSYRPLVPDDYEVWWAVNLTI